MEAITRKVKDIGTADRRALEHVIGRQLGDDQCLFIRVVNVAMTPPTPNTTEG